MTPLPPGDDGESVSGDSELQLDHSMFVQQPSRLSNYRGSPLNVPDDEDSIGGRTDETSLGMSVSINLLVSCLLSVSIFNGCIL